MGTDSQFFGLQKLGVCPIFLRPQGGVRYAFCRTWMRYNPRAGVTNTKMNPGWQRRESRI